MKTTIVVFYILGFIYNDQLDIGCKLLPSAIDLANVAKIAEVI